MIQLRIAILDEETEYLERLNSYMVQKREYFFKIWTFSTWDYFQEASTTNRFHAILATEVFFERVLELEGQGQKILLREEGILPEYQCVPNIYKYQSVERIFVQISNLIWEENGPSDHRVEGKQARLIGIYSPVHYADQMIFSMTMANILGENERVLYLNLQENTGFCKVTDTDAREDIGDLVYGMMQTDHDFYTGLHRVRRNFGNIDYIPPAGNPEHLSEITQNLYEELFLELKNRSGYDVVVVDFGTVFLGFAEILPVFEALYCIELPGVRNRYRVEEFFEYLAREGNQEQLKICPISLSDSMLRKEEPYPLEMSMYGEMGDYIRQTIGGAAGG